ncbi:hypothetical protein A3715_16710 [Oleiphilus sp. HI0009]|nr:hypothetical protein A3715_16710 [Oleiphilus sp. HI0009]
MAKTESTIKVLHLIDSGGLYGAEKMLLTLCSEQIKQGLQPTILSCGTVNEEPKAIELEAERLGIQCKAWRMKAGLNVKGMREIWVWVHEHGFTHLHSHGYKFDILLALTRSQRTSQSLISTVHGYTATSLFSKAGIQQLIDRLLLVSFDAVVWVGGKSNVSPILKTLLRNRLRYIFNGVVVKEVTFIRKISRVKNLLMVGRLSKEKGHIYALEALSILSRDGIDLTMTIAGEGPLEEELKSATEHLEISNRVNFLGFVDDPNKLYISNDLLLLPSLTEGLPLTLLEAFASNLPTLATKVGAIPEVVVEDSFLISDIGSSEAVAKKIKELLSLDDERLKKSVSKVSTKVHAELSATAMATKYSSLYEELKCV